MTLGEAASEQGDRYDFMFNVTVIVTGIVFFITQILLFWFSYRYQESDKRKAYYFSHNNKLELIWTVVPAITLTILVVIGLRNWFAMTKEAPETALQIEVTGKQFGWIYRYPGADGVFGKKYFRNINEDKQNVLGLYWKDDADLNIKADDKAKDDIVESTELYLVKGRPVKLIIGSRDVIHDVGLPHFRMKMDAVPGIPTSIWFTPKYTTKEMKEKTGNQAFEYEIACDQMCGNGHYSMRGLIKVVTQQEYDEWLKKQEPAYYTAFPSEKPGAKTPADSTNPAKADTAKAMAMLGK
jgi:cytochrome c oxidase subunit 2